MVDSQHPQNLLILCSFAYMIFNHIVSNCDLKRKFLSCKDHNAVFIKTVTVLIGTKYSDTGMNSFISITCDKNHIVFGRILQKLFNCFIKNVLKNINCNSFSVRTCNDTSSRRKIAKLTGKSSFKK